MARRDRKKSADRRTASVQRATQRAGGDPRKDLNRERREALAALTPSAGRVLVAAPSGFRSVDPIVAALAFARGLWSLQGAGSDDARGVASLVHRALLGTPPRMLPSGLRLDEVLGVDVTVLPASEVDGLVTVAQVLSDAGARHDAGDLDLYARVAPLGLGRHPEADEIDMVCAAVTPEADLDDLHRPRLVLHDDRGWFEVWPPAAMQAASLGFLVGDVADVVGIGLYGWLVGPAANQVAANGPGALPELFGGADVMQAVHSASQRAGSDHPSVAGPVLLRMLAPGGLQ